MSTVLEIEKAIETLLREQWELHEWFLERDAAISASASVFGLYDAEEGGGPALARMTAIRGKICSLIRAWFQTFS